MRTVMVLMVVFIASAAVTASADPGDTLWTRTYGGGSSETAWCVQQTTDGGYIIAGDTRSFGGYGENAYVVRTNSDGDTLWTRTYDGSGYLTSALSVQQTTDGGYIIAVSSDPSYLWKMDTYGNTQWIRSYACGAIEARQTLDGGYIMAGSIYRVGDHFRDVYLMKTDVNGNTQWTRCYGDSAFSEYAMAVQQTTDGGYIIAATRYRERNWTVADFWVLKTDASGDTLWTRTYGGSGFDLVFSVEQTTDGGYVVGGETNSFSGDYADFYLVKTDASGNALWTRTYGGSGWEEVGFVRQTTDGGYIIAGFTDSFGAGWADSYLVKTDASGDTQWTRTYGGSDGDAAYWLQQTSDGGYIIAGVSNSFGAGEGDFYLVKTIGYPDQNKLLPELILYYDDVDGDTCHDPGEPYFTDPGGHDVGPDNSCWFASACNLLVYEGAANPYLAGLRDGAAPSPNVTPWGNQKSAPGGGGFMTFDDGGWQQWALEFAGQPFIESIKTTSEFGIGGWPLNPIDWCQARLTEWHGIGLTVWSGSVPEGTLPGRFDSNMPFLYHAITLWEINENDSTVTITDSDDQITGIRVLPYTYSNNDWVIQELYPDWNGRVNYAAYLEILTGNIDEGQLTVNVPSDIVLTENYPNPFNTTTEIRYFLPRPTEVRLDIYNLMGQRVEALFDGIQLAGQHSISWDGSHYSSGTYLYKLTAGDKVLTKKMVLLK